MDIFLIASGSILLICFLYILLGIVFSKKINFERMRTPEMLYRNEWKENIPHSLIDPPHKKIYIKSKLGYDLAARFFPSKDKSSHKYLLMLHGYNNCSLTCGKYAVFFNEREINCLAPDSRRCGESGGRGITFGYFERNDAEQWIEEIYKMDEKAEIGVFGISLGAATANLLASTRADIKYVISYCSFSSFKEIICDVGSMMIPKMIKFIYPAIVLGGYLTTGARLDLIDVYAAVKNIKCPILILHSKTDAFTPFKHAEKLHSGSPDSELKFFENAPHARAYSKNPELYKKYLSEFLEKHNF